MMKYVLMKEKKDHFGVILTRIVSVENGNLGGWIEREENLSQDGSAFIYDNAVVSGDATISGNTMISGNAWVYGNARVYGDAMISGDDEVSGNTRVSGNKTT